MKRDEYGNRYLLADYTSQLEVLDRVRLISKSQTIKSDKDALFIPIPKAVKKAMRLSLYNQNCFQVLIYRKPKGRR